MLEPLQEPTVAEMAAAYARPDADRDLAARYAPTMLLDADEPFLPLVAGYTVFRRSAPSPSAHRYVSLGKEGERHADTVIEYAIWWDWDINHLYELEHLWVFLDGNGEVIHAEGSRHGGYRKMLVDGAPPLKDGHLTVFSESGKHGFAPVRGWLDRLAPVTRKLCSHHAGLEGVLITWLFRGIIRAKNPESDRLVHTYLERYAFDPTLEFTRPYTLQADSLVPWPVLFAWIPRRVGWWVWHLKKSIPPDQRRVLRIAQRGASAHKPENTRSAIVTAAEHGADLVKLDVQQSADGVPVIFHGDDLSRTTNGSGPVSRHTVGELKQLDAGEGETLLTLDEALDCCQENHLGVYLEIESEGAIEPAVRAISQRRVREHAAIGAPEPAWLAQVKALERHIRTVILLNSPHLDAVALANAVGADYVQPSWQATPEEMHDLLASGWLREIRAAGLGIVCDHDHCLSDLPKLRQHGVDAICTPSPQMLLPRKG